MEHTRILDVPVSLINMQLTIEILTRRMLNGESQYVCVRDVHGVMQAQEDTSLMEIHNKAGLVTPDGMPLVWICRWRGHKEVKRVCGTDLVAAISGVSPQNNLRHYFFGGKSGVAERMATILVARYPGLIVAGVFTPPFRPMTQEEDDQVTRQIVEARPHIVWVGLSTPKQEFWMRDHVNRIPGATLIGVGAAFDFYVGDVGRAPRWMQEAGLEWFHRLLSEPKRLWRRYLIMAPTFLFRVFTEELRRKLCNSQ